ncbi:hypothetical protein FA15DRAFT_706342 [Coprinopsis marcescibilis]|uniref:Chromatin target of PRMT1 protein C-terminal domain-containing protein n=1 Tax=Coprinopsis marcescibilis TaxID=230819 RepID=A0A5C3KRM7_COPMA|nr:hypothetical protein FA15DRAFT_706342 [Coprinopsis marcescibilis]
MKIEIVVDPIRAAPLASRVAPAAVAAPVVGAPRNGGPVRRRRGGGGGGRGGAGAPGGPGGKRGERPQKSAADLDAEMEDYTAAASGPAAPATA